MRDVPNGSSTQNKKRFKIKIVTLALGSPISLEFLLPSASYQMCFSSYVG